MSTVDRAPTLVTARLVLRAYRPDDFPTARAIWADPLVVRYIGGKPSTDQQSWARLMNFSGQWAMLGFGYWAVTETATGQYVGDVGFADFKRDVVPSMRDVPELGWVLASSVHGRGYATEAVRAATAWGDAHLPNPRTVCMIDEENTASIRVAAKCGYRAFDTTTFNDRPTTLYERLAPPVIPSDVEGPP